MFGNRNYRTGMPLKCFEALIHEYSPGGLDCAGAGGYEWGGGTNGIPDEPLELVHSIIDR